MNKKIIELLGGSILLISMPLLYMKNRDNIDNWVNSKYNKAFSINRTD